MFNLSVDKAVPAYVICHNITMREIAKSQPKSEYELLLINGVGEKFVHNYSKDFLRVIELHKYPDQM